MPMYPQKKAARPSGDFSRQRDAAEAALYAESRKPYTNEKKTGQEAMAKAQSPSTPWSPGGRKNRRGG